MKKLGIVLMIILICSLAAGCAEGNIQMQEDRNREAESSWYKSEGFSNAMKLFDEYIEGNGEQSGVAKTDALQVVKADRISERYYLISYMVAPLYPLTNYHYALADMEKASCEAINLDTIDYISEVSYSDDIITFHCEGNNVVNGLREFPHDLKYVIAKRELTTEYPYKSLQHGEYEISLGIGMNKVGLAKVAENKKSIYFDFEETEGTILAGGWFCPAIKTGLKLDNEDEKAYYVDFEELVLSGESEKQLMDLKKLDYVENVRIRNYKDVHDIDHVAVYFKFKGVTEYTCSFRENDHNGFMDFILTVR